MWPSLPTFHVASLDVEGQMLASVMAKKASVGATDVLIDDYTGNVLEFLTNTDGVAVLVDQPWNRERADLESFVKAGRLFVVSNLLELRIAWPEIFEKAKRPEKASV